MVASISVSKLRLNSRKRCLGNRGYIFFFLVNINELEIKFVSITPSGFDLLHLEINLSVIIQEIL